MPKNVTDETDPGSAERKRQTNAAMEVTDAPKIPASPAKPAPSMKVDKVKSGSYGSKPGEKRIDVSDMVKPLPSYKDGTDSVPETGPAIVHKGEKITPAKDNPMANIYSKITEGDKQPKKSLKEIRVRKAKDGSHIIEHHHHHPAHKMEEHTAKDGAALKAHMDEHVPTMEAQQPEMPPAEAAGAMPPSGAGAPPAGM
jgi:hypothetical protein